MEGRLMMAASAVEFSPAEFQAVSFEIVGLPPYAASRGLVVGLAHVDEGGFVQNPSLSYGVFSDRSNIVTYGVSTSDSNGAIDGLMQRGVADNLPLHGDADSKWFDFDEVNVNGTGLEPVSVPTEPLVDSAGGLESSIVHDSTVLNNFGEGGQIPISEILASKDWMRSDLSPANGLTSEVLLTTDNKQPSLQLAAVSTDRAITGEWARAMILETAGGESNGSGDSKARREDVNPAIRGSSARVDRPLSSARWNQEEDVNQSLEDAIAPTGDADEQSARTTQASVPLPWSLAADRGAHSSSAAEGDSGSGTQSHPTTVIAHLAGPIAEGATDESKAGDLSSSPLDLAFEEIGRRTKSLVQSLEFDSWQRPLAAAPLLIVLALERIATGNSRRNRCNSRAADATPPKLERVGAKRG